MHSTLTRGFYTAALIRRAVTTLTLTYPWFCQHYLHFLLENKKQIESPRVRVAHECYHACAIPLRISIRVLQLLVIIAFCYPPALYLLLNNGLLTVCPTYKVLIYTWCKYALVYNTFASHLRNAHKNDLTSKEIKDCLQTVANMCTQASELVQQLPCRWSHHKPFGRRLED